MSINISLTQTRFNNSPPQLVGRSSYDYAEELYEWLLKSFELSKAIIIPTASPNPVLLGQSGDAGVAQSTVSSDFSQDTTFLMAQIRNIVSMRV
jgi:hypothetical protein